MSSSYALWQIDDANLRYYYKPEETAFGTYYRLKVPAPGFPDGFYASIRDEEMANYNLQTQMAQTSGDAAQAARGINVYDDTTLPSQRIKDGAEANDGQVISSGNTAREYRKKNKK